MLSVYAYVVSVAELNCPDRGRRKALPLPDKAAGTLFYSVPVAHFYADHLFIFLSVFFSFFLLCSLTLSCCFCCCLSRLECRASSSTSSRQFLESAISASFFPKEKTLILLFAEFYAIMVAGRRISPQPISTVSASSYAELSEKRKGMVRYEHPTEIRWQQADTSD